MAGVMLTAQGECTIGQDPGTIVQLVAAANHRIIIHSIELFAQGATSASAQFRVYLVLQTTAGTGGSAMTINKLHSIDTETVQTTGQYGPWGAGTEPTMTTVLWNGAEHEQGSLIYMPTPELRFAVYGGQRVGLVQSLSTGWDSFQFTVRFEE